MKASSGVNKKAYYSVAFYKKRLARAFTFVCTIFTLAGPESFGLIWNSMCVQNCRLLYPRFARALAKNQLKAFLTPIFGLTFQEGKWSSSNVNNGQPSGLSKNQPVKNAAAHRPKECAKEEHHYPGSVMCYFHLGIFSDNWFCIHGASIEITRRKWLLEKAPKYGLYRRIKTRTGQLSGGRGIKWLKPKKFHRLYLRTEGKSPAPPVKGSGARG